MTVKQASPWIASIAVHLLVLLVPLNLTRQAEAGAAVEKRIDLSYIAAAEGAAPREADAYAPRAVGRLPAPYSRPQNSMGLPSRAKNDRPSSKMLPLPRAQAPTTSMPSAQDVLADLSSQKAAVERTERGAPASASVSPQGPAARIGWESAQRKLIRKRDPDFPRILGAVGQEVECEVRITVTPSGNVERVEITKSTGYTEIDASIEAALRDYLFSRVDGRKSAVGTVRFRFRLEQRD